MVSSGAHHSEPSGIVRLTNPSTERQRQAISRSEKLSASIWARGEYLVPGRTLYIHMNNTNPILDADSPEAAEVARAGLEIARDGQEFEV